MKERGREGERNSLVQAFFLGFRVNISLSAILNEVFALNCIKSSNYNNKYGKEKNSWEMRI